MESKTYAERVGNIKAEIVNEIRSLIPNRTEVHFDDKFFIHYVDGEVATTETCKAVMKCGNGDVNLLVELDYGEESVIEENRITGYEPKSLIEILNHTEKAIRDQKLAKLRNLVKNAGGEISFDGKFRFNGVNNGFDVDDCLLTNIRWSDGEIIIEDLWMDEKYENDEDFIETDELDRMIAYVEEKTKESFALTDEQNAAVDELAKCMKKVVNMGLKILVDFNEGDLSFLNTNGKDIRIVPKGFEPSPITDMVQNYGFAHYGYNSLTDDIVLA